jgi:hypothetical protein
MSATANKKANLGTLSNKVYDLLQGLDAEDRTKILASVTQLYGDNEVSTNGVGGISRGSAPDTASNLTGEHNPQEYCKSKDPQNKGELLAVAARYHEIHAKSDASKLEDFVAFFNAARRNFDRHNFLRDMKNAQIQAGLFNTGGGRGQYRLSYYGQQYVDALPDREAVKKLKRPSRKKKITKRRPK